MIRKDWYKTIIIETKEGVDQLKKIRSALSEHRTDITDFEVERADNGNDMIIRFGLKLYETRAAAQIIDEIKRLDGIKNVKWEMD